MATGTAERKQATRANQVGAPPPEPEHLPCPRCSSTNTKFCYYNNYNFSQPRHFCKQCRRYWTHGGTLRDIPIGGGSRKNAKRSRTAPSAAAAPHHHDFRSFPSAASQLLVPFAADHGGAGPFGSDGKVCGSFTSLLNTQGAGLWALGGFGLGLGHGIEDVGFGLGRAVWPFHGIVEGGPTGGTGGVSSVAGNTWQLESGESGFSNGDCFTLPELAISTPGVNYLK